MMLWLTLADGRDAEIEIGTEGGRAWLEVAGRRLEADFQRLPDGEVYSLLIDGHSHEVRVSPTTGGALAVSVANRVVEVEVRHPLEKLLGTMARAGGRSAGETIAAPMPGVVVALRVKQGDTVAAGQSVVVMEAMKMQNELAARAGGVVSEILVAERAAVAAGQPLVRLKAVPA